MKQKLELYIISLFLLFLLLFLDKVPIYFGRNWAFIGFKSLFTDNLILGISIIFMLLSGVFYIRFNYHIMEGAANLPVQVTRIENCNFESITFLATYIIPIVCFNLEVKLEADRNLFMMLSMLFIMGWIYIKTNLFYTNPTLALLGFHIYRIDTIKQTSIIIIAKSKVKKEDWLLCKQISDNIFYAKLKK